MTTITEKTVIREDVPNLMGVGYLHAVRGVVDTGELKLCSRALAQEAPLRKLTSGHMMVRTVPRPGTTIRLPQELKRRYPWLEEGAFELGGPECADAESCS